MSARQACSVTVTIMFASIVEVAQLLGEIGDERARDVLQAHHDLISESIETHHGRELHWHRGELMAAFDSTALAVECATQMQRTTHLAIEGERLSIRVGLNIGEVAYDEVDYSGLAVVMARRLCDVAEPGQILCSDLVAAMLVGRRGINFSSVGALDLKGVPEPVAALDVLGTEYEGAEVPTATAMAGRGQELRRLEDRLARAIGGHGGLVTVSGEAGMGKTRLAEEIATRARSQQVNVMWGACFEGDWTPPYASFADALEGEVLSADPTDLEADLAGIVSPLGRLVPKIYDNVPETDEATGLTPEEERHRLFDAMTRFIVRRSERAPLILVIEDLHWAGRGSVAMLRHVAHVAAKQRILIVATYRDEEINDAHPAADALRAMRRETEFTNIELGGLDTDGVEELLGTLAVDDVPRSVSERLGDETAGNPFFLREVVLHLIEEGSVIRDDKGGWSLRRAVGELGIPSGVRDVIVRRLSRLSSPANDMLAAAAAFDDQFHLGVVVDVTQLDEQVLLDALDETLAFGILKPGESADTYRLAHALFRHALYADLNPSRRLRLHRRVADSLADPGRSRVVKAAEVAGQYYLSRELPGAERGIDFAMTAAAEAGAAGGHDKQVAHLNIALELAGDDERSIEIVKRLGLALVWALRFDEAEEVIRSAADRIVAAGYEVEARSYLAEAAFTSHLAGSTRHAWSFAQTGLSLSGPRDVSWALLTWIDYERRETTDDAYTGLVLKSVERRDAAEILEAHLSDRPELKRLVRFYAWGMYESREEVLASDPDPDRLVFWAGEFQRGLDLMRAEADAAKEHGRNSQAGFALSSCARCLALLGRLPEACETYDEARELAATVPGAGWVSTGLLGAHDAVALAHDDGWEELLEHLEPVARRPAEHQRWAHAAVAAAVARAFAHLGRRDDALDLVDQTMPSIEAASAWAANFIRVACDAAETLWLLDERTHSEAIERALRQLVTGPDFRFPMMDGRLALARLCALDGRFDEAETWLAESRQVLHSQNARTLLAIADLDEAKILLRRGDAADVVRAAGCRDSALVEFEQLGMRGWAERAARLDPERLGGLDQSVR